MEQLLLGELGGNASTAHQIAPGMFSFRPGPPTEEEIRQQAAADARKQSVVAPVGKGSNNRRDEIRVYFHFLISN